MKRILFTLLLFSLLGAFILTSCKKEDTVYFIKCEPSSLQVPCQGGEQAIVIDANTAWDLTVGADWATSSLSQLASAVDTPINVLLTFTINTDTLTRTQDIRVVSRNNAEVVATLRVVQAGQPIPEDPEDPEEPEDPEPVIPDTIQLAMTSLEIACVSRLIPLEITSNAVWSFAGSSETWCGLQDETIDRPAGVDTVYVRVDASKEAESRKATLTFKTANDSTVCFEVTQRKLGISVPEDLIALRDSVNQAKGIGDFMDADSVIQLWNDLDLSHIANWEPIGSFLKTTEANGFRGNFNGNGHTIRHLNITQSKFLAVGLFGYVRKGTVRQLSLSDAHITCDMSQMSTTFDYLTLGGICGWNYAGTIDDCHFSGTIQLDTASTLEVFVGGIVGTNIKDTEGNVNALVSNCTNEGVISARSRVGGIVGTNMGGAIISKCTNRAVASLYGNSIVGGVCGQNYNNSVIEDCKNNGMVSSFDALGGICGWQMSSSSVTGSENAGRITSFDAQSIMGGGIGGIVGVSNGSLILTSSNIGTIEGSLKVGGICGEMTGLATSIENCTNRGSISGDNQVGGISGLLYDGASIASCTNFQEATVTAITDAGGICGVITSDNSLVSGCDNYAPITAQYYAAGIVSTTVCEVRTCHNYGTIEVPMTETGVDLVAAGGIMVSTSQKVANCNNEGTVNGASAAGIAVWHLGASSNNSVTNCDNVGTITGTNRAAGIVGMISANASISDATNSGAISGATLVAGIVAFNTRGEHTNCANTGSVTGLADETTGSFFAGGICGNNKGGNFTDCTNSGTVTRTYDLGESKYVGGICGSHSADGNDTSYGKLTRCINEGAVNGYHNIASYNYVGGLCGFFWSGTATECENKGSVNGETPGRTYGDTV